MFRPGIPMLLLLACGGGQEAREAPGEAAGTNVPLTALKVEAPDPTSLPEKGAVIVIGYPDAAMNGDWPKPGTKPALVWTTGARRLSWPLDLEVPLPEGLTFLVIVDVDGDGKPGPQDRIAAPVRDRAAGGTLAVQLDRTFDPDSAHQEGDGTLGLGPGGPQVPGVEMRLHVSLSASLAGDPAGAVFVLSFAPGRLQGGSPHPGSQPALFWKAEAAPRVAPFDVLAPAAPGHDVVLLIDADGDGSPGPGDLLGGPVPIPADAVAGRNWDLLVDRRWTPSAPGGPGQVAGVPVPLLLRAVKGQQLPDAAPIFVASYPQEGVVLGRPKPGLLPLRTWSQPAAPLRWPARVQAEVTPGATVLAFLDSSADGVPGPGDLISEPATIPADPAAGTLVELEFRGRVFDPGGPTALVTTIVLQPARGIALPRDGAFFVVSYPAGSLRDGLPTPGLLPTRMWARSAGPVVSPLRMESEIVAGATALVVWDADGSGAPGPGDTVSDPLTVPAALAAGQSLLVTWTGRRFEVAGGPSAATGGLGEGTPVRLSLSKDASVAAPAKGAIFVLGYPAGGLQEGAPAPGITPAFYWSRPAEALVWPATLDARARAGLQHVVLVDRDADGSPGPGDLLSEVVAVPPTLTAGTPLQARLQGRTFGTGTASGPVGGGPNQDQGVPLSVRLEGGPGITLPPRAAVFIAGYGPDGLDDGLPRQGSRPLLYWSREAQPISLPATFSARALVGASHIAIVDADGDGAAGPGDWVSAPVPVPQKPSGPLTFRIERRFEPRGALTSGGPLGGATPPALPPALRGLERKLRLSVASGLAAPNSAPAFVLGFPDSAMLEGSPRAGVRPLFAWQSPRLQLAAPVEFLGQLPADLLTVVVVVDVDDDGQPGPGDLMSAPRPSFRAPGGSDAVAFVLDRSFSVPQKGPGPQQGPTTNDEDVKDRGAEPILPSWLRGGK